MLDTENLRRDDQLDEAEWERVLIFGALTNVPRHTPPPPVGDRQVARGERIVIERVPSDRKLKASRQGSK